MKGFTLIEILIVVAIIVALIAIAFGAAGLSKERDRFMASCLEHERQYECDVKWKQMHPDPIVVYAPFNK